MLYIPDQQYCYAPCCIEQTERVVSQLVDLLLAADGRITINCTVDGCSVCKETWCQHDCHLATTEGATA